MGEMHKFVYILLKAKLYFHDFTKKNLVKRSHLFNFKYFACEIFFVKCFAYIFITNSTAFTVIFSQENFQNKTISWNTRTSINF